VENLWTDRANPVEKPSAQIFLGANQARTARAMGRRWRLRDPLRLFDRAECIEFVSGPQLSFGQKQHVTVHRYEEIIGGRAYQIEVTLVSNRWRAQLRRRPGVPTAMMPFYGQTPDEAARQLAQWLTLAHSRLGAVAPKSSAIS